MSWLLVAAALLVAGPRAPAAPAKVLIVSIDALHPDALTARSMPHLRSLMERGDHTLLGRSTRPPKTLVAHTAMLTGLTPERSGKTDNAWEEGEPTVKVRTLFDVAKGAGYRTAFFYSKEKLGYLSGAAVDERALAPEDGVVRARRALARDGRSFVFLHVSGLEFAGMEHGWLSAAYLDEARAIDATLFPLLAEIERRGDFLLVVTSDHAGHGLEHGTDHPDDARLPLILRSDRRRFGDVRGKRFDLTSLMPLVAPVLQAR